MPVTHVMIHVSGKDAAMTERQRFEPYHVIKRKTRKGKVAYYVRFVDPQTGNTIRERSSGQTSRSAAGRWAEAELAKVSANVEGTGTVRTLAEGFWKWDAPYARGRRARGKSISRGFLDISESYTRNHIIPRWGDTEVSDITAAEIDTWVLELHDRKSLSSATVNKILQTLRTLLDGAVSRGLIRLNPAKAVEPLKESHEKRGILTDDEVRALLLWPGPFADYRMYAINLLAFTTGIRMGEVRALDLDSIKETHIIISRSWEEGYGIKPPKNGQSRAIPIPRYVQEVLQEIITTSKAEDLVFHGRTKSVPISKSHIVKALREAIIVMKLKEAGAVETMNPAEIATARRELLRDIMQRQIGFHSWRHKLNTMLRAAGVPDPKIRLLTGHRADGMTDWYTRFAATDLEDVTAAQTRLLPDNEPILKKS